MNGDAGGCSRCGLCPAMCPAPPGNGGGSRWLGPLCCSSDDRASLPGPVMPSWAPSGTASMRWSDSSGSRLGASLGLLCLEVCVVSMPRRPAKREA